MHRWMLHPCASHLSALSIVVLYYCDLFTLLIPTQDPVPFAKPTLYVACCSVCSIRAHRACGTFLMPTTSCIVFVRKKHAASCLAAWSSFVSPSAWESSNSR